MAALVTAWPPAGRSEPAAASVDPEHLVAGLAASYCDWRPDQFSRFLEWCGDGRDGEPRLPLFCDHEQWRFTSHGRESADVGVCLEFAAVPPWTGFPGGLAVLAALHPARAPQILRDMRDRGQWTAMSIGGVASSIGECQPDLWVGEVSLTRPGDQADEGALVLGTGPDAAEVWELLTGDPAAVLRAVEP